MLTAAAEIVVGCATMNGRQTFEVAVEGGALRGWIGRVRPEAY